MVEYLFKVLQKFPLKYKNFKERIETKLFDILDFTDDIKYESISKEKFLMCMEFDKKLNSIGRLVRFANNKNNFINNNILIGKHQYRVASEIIAEIRKINIGLMKSIKARLERQGEVINSTCEIYDNSFVEPNLNNPNPYIDIKDNISIQNKLADLEKIVNDMNYLINPILNVDNLLEQ